MSTTGTTVDGPRVEVVQLSPAALAALAEGDLPSAQAASPVALSSWLASPDAVGTWRVRARQVAETPADLPWVTGVLRDLDTGLAVGKAGFHAAPDPDGMVELGYAVDPAHRRRGYARAALELAIDRARRDPDVRVLRVTVSPDNLASTGLVEQYPFVRNGEQWDDEDGLELIWELDCAGS